MKVYLVHHADALTVEQDPLRHLSPKGRKQADRLGARLRALGVKPSVILHSDKQWTIETAERIAAQLGIEDRTATAAYPIGTDDPVGPFIEQTVASGGEVMMCGHVDFLERAAARFVGGDERRKVVAFKPGNATLVCLEGADERRVITFMWREEHAPG